MSWGIAISKRGRHETDNDWTVCEIFVCNDQLDVMKRARNFVDNAMRDMSAARTEDFMYSWPPIKVLPR